MFLVKDLRFVRGLLGYLSILSGVLLTAYILGWRESASLGPDWLYLLLSASMVAGGLVVLYSSTSTVTILNKELGVVTISYSNPFSTSTVQYGFHEINVGLGLQTEYLLGRILRRHLVCLVFSPGQGVTIARGSDRDLDLLTESVIDGNNYLKPTPILIHEALEESVV